MKADVKVVPVAANPFRRFCKLKGISGKGKKKFRKAQRELASKNANSLKGLVI